MPCNNSIPGPHLGLYVYISIHHSIPGPHRGLYVYTCKCICIYKHSHTYHVSECDAEQVVTTGIPERHVSSHVYLYIHSCISIFILTRLGDVTQSMSLRLAYLGLMLAHIYTHVSTNIYVFTYQMGGRDAGQVITSGIPGVHVGSHAHLSIHIRTSLFIHQCRGRDAEQVITTGTPGCHVSPHVYSCIHSCISVLKDECRGRDAEQSRFDWHAWALCRLICVHLYLYSQMFKYSTYHVLGRYAEQVVTTGIPGPHVGSYTDIHLHKY